jgi:phytoene dehydrogenase-like protein
MTNHITIIGGGIAGLTAAIACGEEGVPVRLFEAHKTLGGRGRAISGPYLAHEGGHVFYADGPHYTWLKERGLVRGLGWPSATQVPRLGFRADGRIRHLPPPRMLSAQVHPRLRAPVDTDFRTWASRRWGEKTAEQMANAISVVTYDADTGRLSAAFVWDLFQRVLGQPRVPAIRWVRGGWHRVIERMVSHAENMGVTLETDSRVDEVSTVDGPVIVATEMTSARSLLGDDSLDWTSGDCALLDLAVRRSAADGAVVFDLDEGGFHESYSMQDDSVAPAGESLFQLQMPIRSGESHDVAAGRLRTFADAVLPGWGDRTTYHRTATAKGRTGANDLPGQTWRDRPAIDRGDGVYLAGDMVAAPGMRGEIAINSALRAARSAVTALAPQHIR